MEYVNLNGELIPSGKPIMPAKSRWLQTGHAVVEEMRVFKGKIPFLNDHVNQLELSVNQLRMEPKKYFTPIFFEKEITRLLEKNELHNAAVTINVFREGDTYSSSLSPEAGFLITTRKLESDHYNSQEKGIRASVFDTVHQPQHEFAALNSINQLVRVSAIDYAQVSKLDEAIILNTSGRPVMFSKGALLIYLNNELLFPVYSEGAPPDILREYLLPIANRMNINHRPAEITLEMLKEADEIMHVNEITGLQSVAAIDDQKYRGDFTRKLLVKLVEIIRSR